MTAFLVKEKLKTSGNSELDPSSLVSLSILDDRVSSPRDELGFGFRRALWRLFPRLLEKEQV